MVCQDPAPKAEIRFKSLPSSRNLLFGKPNCKVGAGQGPMKRFTGIPILNVSRNSTEPFSHLHRLRTDLAGQFKKIRLGTGFLFKGQLDLGAIPIYIHILILSVLRIRTIRDSLIFPSAPSSGPSRSGWGAGQGCRVSTVRPGRKGEAPRSREPASSPFQS